jgi:branched-chain amino acid transport system substrate-binding protein
LSSRQDRVSLETKDSSKETRSRSEDSKDKSNNQSSSPRLSLGEKILVTADNNSEKEAGTQAFAAGDFASATVKFKSSLDVNRNDPETWIYWNNATAANSGNYIKIAVSVPIGGNLNVAKEMLRGVAQSQNEINQKGGIGGKLVVVEIANDNNDPEVAKQIASELVKDSSVLAVIGHNSSDVTLATAPIYQQGKLVVISPTSVASKLSGIGSYIFRTTPSTRTIAETLARYTVESAHKTKIAICADSQAQASSSFKEEFTLAVFDRGGKITNTVCDFSNPNFNPADISSQAISDGANALLLAPSIDQVNKAIEVARANNGRLALLGSQAMYVFETLQEGQSNTSGTVLSVVWHPDSFSNSVFPQTPRKCGVGLAVGVLPQLTTQLKQY